MLVRRVRRVLLTIAAAIGGAGCIIGGVAVKSPGEYEGGDVFGVWEDLGNTAERWAVGWFMIVVGVMLLLAVVASVVPLAYPADLKRRARRGEARAAGLPEARVHERSPDPRNGK